MESAHEAAPVGEELLGGLGVLSADGQAQPIGFSRHDRSCAEGTFVLMLRHSGSLAGERDLRTEVP